MGIADRWGKAGLASMACAEVAIFSDSGGTKGLGVCEVPMITVPEPPITTLPWSPRLPRVAAGLPLISTLGTRLLDRVLPQPVLSPARAAGRPSKKTSGEPLAMGLFPCPVFGQLLESPRRAAGLPDMTNFLIGMRGGTLSKQASGSQAGCRFSRAGSQSPVFMGGG